MTKLGCLVNLLVVISTLYRENFQNAIYEHIYLTIAKVNFVLIFYLYSLCLFKIRQI